MTEDDADRLFHAMSHAVRRRILDLTGANPGITVGDLARNFDISRIAVMNHLAVLEQASLIVSERAGTARHLYLNATPIRMIYERWTTEYSGHWAGLLLRIKEAAEKRASDRKRGHG